MSEIDIDDVISRLLAARKFKPGQSSLYTFVPRSINSFKKVDFKCSKLHTKEHLEQGSQTRGPHYHQNSLNHR